jgi:serine protease
VAGTIAAKTNNGTGVAGVAFNAKIVPVRVLGKCGGYTSDIADAIIWASGGTVAGVPPMPTQARVINMSLGGGGACDITTQNAINSARSRGTVVVVAAGNETPTPAAPTRPTARAWSP